MLKLNFIAKIHRYLGLFLALNFFILSLTGTILIWKHELESSHQEETEITKTNLSPSQLSSLEKKLTQKRSDILIQTMAIQENNNTVFLFIPKGKSEKDVEIMQFNARGEIIDNEKHRSTILDFIMDLHANLFLGKKGTLLLGVLSLFLLLSIILGYFASFKLKKISKLSSLKIKKIYLHSLLGKKVLPWLLLVVTTGAIISFSDIMVGIFFKTSIPQTSNTKSLYLQRAPISHVLSTLNSQKALEEMKVQYVFYPNSKFSSPALYSVLMRNKETKNPKLVVLDAKSGNIQQIINLPWYLLTLLASMPLHFGDFGGVFLKVIWTIFGLISTYIPVSGILIFLRKKKANKTISSYNVPEKASPLKEVTLTVLFMTTFIYTYISEEILIGSLVLLILLTIDWYKILINLKK